MDGVILWVILFFLLNLDECKKNFGDKKPLQGPPFLFKNFECPQVKKDTPAMGRGKRFFMVCPPPMKR